MVATALCAALFFILHSLLFSTVVRAQPDCHMDDENLTTCCPVEGVAEAAPGLWEQIKSFARNIPLNLFSLTVRDFKVSEKFDEAIDYYYGRIIKNEEGEDEIDPGVFFKLAPPNLLEKELPTKGAKIAKREENAKWLVDNTRESGNEGTDALNDGKLENEAYSFSIIKLQRFLTARPKAGGGPSSYQTPKMSLASYPSRAATPQSPGEVLGNAYADLCNPEVVEADTNETCTPIDPHGKGATVGDLIDVLTGDSGLFPKIANLDFIGRFTAGDETEDGPFEKDAFDDPYYESGGFLEIFKLPGEEYTEHNAEGSAELTLNVDIPIIGTWSIGLGRKDLKLRHQGSDTEAREKEGGVWDKLTVPTAENARE